jgi:hypothetical protein
MANFLEASRLCCDIQRERHLMSDSAGKKNAPVFGRMPNVIGGGAWRCPF